jgi:hypothetical protein
MGWVCSEVIKLLRHPPEREARREGVVNEKPAKERRSHLKSFRLA